MEGRWWQGGDDGIGQGRLETRGRMATVRGIFGRVDIFWDPFPMFMPPSRVAIRSHVSVSPTKSASYIGARNKTLCWRVASRCQDLGVINQLSMLQKLIVSILGWLRILSVAGRAIDSLMVRG